MIYKDIFEYKSSLQAKPAASAAVLVKDEFLREMSKDLLLPAYKACLGVSASTQVDAAACSQAFLSSHFAQKSLFQEKTLLIVNQAHQLSKEAQQLLAKETERQLRSHPVFMIGAALNHKSTLYQTIIKTAIVLEIEEGKKWEIEKITERWIIEKAKQLKINLPSQASKRLIESSKEDFYALKNELEKAALDPQSLQRNNEQPLDDQKPRDAAPWQIADHLMQGRLKQACKELFSAIEAGESCIGTLYQIRRFIQRQLIYSGLLNEPNGHQLLLKRYPNLNSYALQKISQESQQISKKTLFSLLSAIDQVEWQLKDNSSGCDERILLLNVIFANLKK